MDSSAPPGGGAKNIYLPQRQRLSRRWVWLGPSRFVFSLSDIFRWHGSVECATRPPRRPLEKVIVGRLIGSQMLALFTTPVIYLYMERLRVWGESLRRRVSRKPAIMSGIAGV